MSKNKSHHTGQHQPHRTGIQTAALFYVFVHGFIFWALARSMPAEETSYALILFGLSSVASVIAGIAMWFWKRWGGYLYLIASFLLGGTALLVTGSMTMMFGAILPMFIVLIIFKPVYKYFK